MTIGIQPDASGTFATLDIGGVPALTIGAEGVRTGVKQLQSVSASVAANALTVGLNPTSLDFRDTSATSGVANTRTAAAALSLIVPSGATLGTVNGQAARLALLAIDNAGTVELAVVNMGGTNLDETALISTTAISAAATSASTIYSANARTNVPFRVVGFLDITQATAGVWVSAPTLVKGAGGQALAVVSSLGYGQTWQNLNAQRAGGTTYYNTTGKPIMVHISGVGNGAFGWWASATINGLTITYMMGSYHTTGSGGCIIIPVGASYSLSFTNFTVSAWHELR